MKECSKAVRRWMNDSNFVRKYFVGHGIDIGAGPDPLGLYAEFFPMMRGCDAWDLPQGDAQMMAGVADAHYDFAHSAHCLEHMADPAAALGAWFRIVKPGGHLVVVVPDEDLYEQGRFPSTYNRDHKWTFTIRKAKSWSPRSVNLLDLLASLDPAAELLSLQLLTATYRDRLPRFDQTLTPLGECAIEAVIRRRTAAELERGGRLSPDGAVDPRQFVLLTGLELRRPERARG